MTRVDLIGLRILSDGGQPHRGPWAILERRGGVWLDWGSEPTYHAAFARKLALRGRTPARLVVVHTSSRAAEGRRHRLRQLAERDV